MALSNAERQKAYRERKKAEKDMQSRGEAGKVSGSPDMGAEGRCESCSPLDLQAPVPQCNPLDSQAPKETKMIVCPAEAVQGLEQRYAELDWQAPICPVPGSAMQAPDSELRERYRKELQPEPVLDEPLTYFDVYKRRHDGMFK